MIWNTGQVSTVDRPNGSKLMLWIRDVALKHDSDDCLIWPFSGSSNGYGSTVRQGKKLYIHRYICELVRGPAPTPKHHAAHSCDNGPGGCVNFKHLSWKTSAENQLDRFRGPRRKVPRDKLQPGHIMTRAVPFTQKAIERAVKAVERLGYKVGGVKPDGTVLVYSGDERPESLSIVPTDAQTAGGTSWDKL
jgi:hypothetical protein